MANVKRTKAGTYEIRFMIAPDDRRSFYPGRNCTKRQAETIGGRLDRLAFAAGHNETPPLDVAQWLATLSDKQYTKLVGWGLVEPRAIAADAKPSEAETPMTLDRWIKRYLMRGTWKPGTVEQLEITAGNLRTFFGKEKPLADITTGDAEDFRFWLMTKAKQVPDGAKPEGLAHNTVRRRIGRSKEMFAAAVKHKVIPESPFADEVAATGANVENHRFIPADWIEKIIRVAPCEDWRIMLAFARYGGMRSHETRLQRWEDIDIPNRRMVIRSNKTPPTRVCPIFPELLPHLMRAREMAPEGAETVVTRYTPEANVLTTFYKLIDRAGLTRWPDAFQNLRRSRETELMGVYPIKDVALWIGNSVPVAMKHYAMAMEDSFSRAIIEGAIGVPNKTPQKTPQSMPLNGNQGQSPNRLDAEKPRKNPPLILTEAGFSYPARTRT